MSEQICHRQEDGEWKKEVHCFYDGDDNELLRVFEPIIQPIIGDAVFIQQLEYCIQRVEYFPETIQLNFYLGKVETKD